MGYSVICSCGQASWAHNIIDLISHYTDHTLGDSESGKGGWIVCPTCGQRASVLVESTLQEEGETWKRHIKAVIPIRTDFDTYTPYVFLTAEEETVTGIHFNYFKDTRKQGGKLKHGHGPGGAPVLSVPELLALLQNLVSSGTVSPTDLEMLVKTGSPESDTNT